MKKAYRRLFCLVSVFTMSFLIAACGKVIGNTDVFLIIFLQNQKLIINMYLDMKEKDILQQEISVMQLQLQEKFYRPVIVKMYHHIQA